MSMDSMISLQRHFMDMLGIPGNRELEVGGLLSSPHFMSAAIGVVSEGAEVLDALNDLARPWVTMNDSEKKRLFLEEIIDVQFYLLELYNIMNLRESDIFQQYLRKYSINCARVFETKVKDPVIRKEMLRDEMNKDLFRPVRPPQSPVQMVLSAIAGTIMALAPADHINDIIDLVAESPKKTIGQLYDGQITF